MTSVAVLFSTFNGAATLPRMLDALEKLEAPPGGWMLVAVDNASTDESGGLLRARQSGLPLTVLFEPRQGKNFGLNRGLRAIDADLVVLTDDDIIPPPDWLTSFHRIAAARPSYDVFGGAIHPLWPQTPPEWILRAAPKGHFAWTDFADGPADPLSIWGPNMAVRGPVLKEHRFHEGIGPDGALAYATGSESEFVLRLSRAGCLCWHARDVAVGHIVRPNQLTPEWLLRRSYSQARGERRLERLHAAEGERLFGREPGSVGDYARAALDAGLATVFGDPEARFKAGKRLHELRGDRDELRAQNEARSFASPASPGPGEDRRRLIGFLRARGATKHPHYRGSLLDHMVRTFRVLEAAGLRREVCLGGGLHSVYGTNLLEHVTVDLSRRGDVRRAFGAEVELLAYLFAVLDRPRTLAAPLTLDAEEAVVVLNSGAHVTLARSVFDDLRWMECANLLDQSFLDDHPPLKALWETRGGAANASQADGDAASEAADSRVSLAG